MGKEKENQLQMQNETAFWPRFWQYNIYESFF